LFLSAVAQRTRTLRLGPLVISITHYALSKRSACWIS
jgi:alkanesulfonate monooxygenase SsuD/methylene tetrahydromethanopterin reductase-like flavin-dependent oxidoreductase (luciferase family)